MRGTDASRAGPRDLSFSLSHACERAAAPWDRSKLRRKEYQRHEREHPSEDAGQQPEVRPAELDEAVATLAMASFFVMGQQVCSHTSPPRAIH